VIESKGSGPCSLSSTPSARNRPTRSASFAGRGAPTYGPTSWAAGGDAAGWVTAAVAGCWFAAVGGCGGVGCILRYGAHASKQKAGKSHALPSASAEQRS
jgi:hypothetical protein